MLEEILTEEERQEGWFVLQDGQLVYLFKGKKVEGIFSIKGMTENNIKINIRRIINRKRGIEAKGEQ